MSKKSAVEFLTKLDKDKALRNEVTEATNHFVKIAAKHGHKFTKEELNKAMIEKWGPPKHREEHSEPYTCCFSEAPGR